MKQHLIFWTVAAILFALVAGCATTFRARVEQQRGESVAFIGEEPAALAHLALRKYPLVIRSIYLVDAEAATNQSQTNLQYVEGRDFVVNYEQGTVRRTPGSRLPDFRTNMLYGQEGFDHSKFPGFGNTGYFAFVDYGYVPSAAWPVQKRQTQFLKATQRTLERGGELRIVAFGDSITAGGDASRPELIFWRRWSDELQRKYPRAHVTTSNGATPGDTTIQGLQRLQAKVLEQSPGLVLIGFGMNDHNVNSVPLAKFEQNLTEMISRIRKQTGAEIILFSAFPPNPKWKFGSHRMEEYAAATAAVAEQTACAYADVFNNWQTLSARKKPEDLLGNNVNHPNDFGHWIYFRVFQELGL